VTGQPATPIPAQTPIHSSTNPQYSSLNLNLTPRTLFKPKHNQNLHSKTLDLLKQQQEWQAHTSLTLVPPSNIILRTHA
jgi:hypothetical protein